MNTTNLASSEDHWRQTRFQNSAGAFGGHSAGANGMSAIPGSGSIEVRRYGGAEFVPVLCVNTWEHAYLLDWGMKGKREYLEAWWDRIDWETVAGHCPVRQEKSFAR
jgi:Fe-Mn family superoxide dismutase